MTPRTFKYPLYDYRNYHSENIQVKSLHDAPFLVRFLSPAKLKQIHRGETTYTYVRRETTDDR